MGLRMARTTPEQIETVRAFLDDLEYVIERGEVVAADGMEVELIRSDHELVEWLRERWKDVSAVHCRVMANCSVLYENCCDHELPHLDWRPEVKALLVEAGLDL